MISALAKIGKPVLKLGMEAAQPVRMIAQNEMTRRFVREMGRNGRFLTITTVNQGVKKGTVALLCLASAVIGWRLKSTVDQA